MSGFGEHLPLIKQQKKSLKRTVKRINEICIFYKGGYQEEEVAYLILTTYGKELKLEKVRNITHYSSITVETKYKQV